MKHLTQMEAKAIRELEDLAGVWPMSLMLFSHSRSLFIVDRETMEVLKDLSGIIPNDGGDPGTYDVGDHTYLKLR